MKKNNEEYYLEAFCKIENGNILSWNTAAFLFWPIWLMYRKIYGFFLVSLIFIFARFCDLTPLIHGISEALGLSKSFNIYFFSGSGGMILYAIYAVFCGIFGNYLYYNAVKRRIKRGYYETDFNVLFDKSRKSSDTEGRLYFLAKS